MTNNDPRKNASGCLDLTAYDAIKNIEDEQDKVHKIIGCIKRVCELSGFDIEGRITLVNKETGRIWR